MTRLALVGAGKIGMAIAEMLSATGDYAVTLFDRDETTFARIGAPGLRYQSLLVENPKALAAALGGHDIVVNAGPYHLAPAIAGAAKDVHAHYFDLTEDVESTRAVARLAERATTAFVPQCGLAPGFVSIAAMDLACRFEKLRDLSLRVGALPLYPTNALRYNLTWSTEGLINEYLNPCAAVVDGHLAEVPALEELESLSLDGVVYEAFNTSGGLGTLCDTLVGKVETLNYKTVRYPGHRDIIKMLVKDLRLGRRRDVLKDVLETAIPMTLQDVVLVFVSASGMREGRLTQESDSRKIYAGEIAGVRRSAIQITTAAGVCTMVDLMVAGKLPRQGFVRQEQASLADVLANRFGRIFDGKPLALKGSAPALVA